MAITIQPIKDNRNGQTPDNGAQMVDKINSNFKNVSEEIGEVDGDAVHLGDQSSQVNYETPKTSADMAIQAVKDVKGVITGLGVTGIIQSSSATTVMVVGFVNAGLLTLTQAISVIMGANIGTTLTAWIIAVFGFKADISILAVPRLLR